MLDAPLLAQTALRPPSQVMRLARLGAAFPTRLSFLRSLLRRLSAEGARLRRPVWRFDAAGYGHAVYTIPLGGHTYSLVAIATHLPDEQRTDRVIATAWDSAFVLYDGIPDAAEIARIVATAPLQEAGRFTQRDLVLSRANKSVRLFEQVTQALRAGRQPEAQAIRDVGYLMRTTAVYGNGKFGIADRGQIVDRPGMSGPFVAEMLTVWMIRSFTHDLVEHIGGAPLDRGLKRHLGIGNATGLGMAPFLVAHPVLLNNWIMARETALARVLALGRVPSDRIARLRALADRAARHLAEWRVSDPMHQARIDRLRAEWPHVVEALGDETFCRAQPLPCVMKTAACLSCDTQELTAALLIEPFGDLVDGLCEGMGDPFEARGVPLPDTAALRAAIAAQFGWALEIDFDDPAETRQFWYVSEEKQEPRLGLRHAEPGCERELPLDVARRVQALWHALPDRTQPLRDFRAAHPQHDLAIARVQIAQGHPCSDIRDNLIGACLPIDMLRCKLAFFGATRFDPKSDRWTRVTLAQGAPLPDELGTKQADGWWLPVFAA